jgi:hypothetical protein
MKKWIAILFVSLLCLQAVPVLHFFASEKSVFYAYVDEDKPDECKLKQKKESNDCLSGFPFLLEADPLIKQYSSLRALSLPAPYLESFTPPPDFTC